MKPYPGKNLMEEERIFDYRLSRSRRTIHNTLGILAAKFRIYRGPIKANISLCEKIVKATICLHNYLRLTENATYLQTGFVDSYDSSGNIKAGEWRSIVGGGGGGILLTKEWVD